jgi:hypothetical protein
MADNILLTFQLASHGMLRPNCRGEAQEMFRSYSKNRDRLLSSPGRRAAHRQYLAKLSRGDGDKATRCQSPGRVALSGEGGRASPDSRHRRPRGSSPAARERSGDGAESEGPPETLPGEWPYLRGPSQARHAVISLDTAKAGQVMEFWREKGLPLRDTAVEDAENIVAAAVKKGQGLLLTVGKVAWGC